MKKRAVFLDRDGVLNRTIIRNGKPYPPASVDELEIMPGVVDGLQRLKEANFVLIVVSNQPDVRRGITSRSTVEDINNSLAKLLPIDRFKICYHDNSDVCDCRKPNPGMLIAGAGDFDIDMASSYMVGDRWKDMEAGISAGCRTIFIEQGYNEKQPKVFDYKVSYFTDAVNIIMEGEM